MELVYEDFTHIKLMAEEGLQFSDLPPEIRNRVSYFKGCLTNAQQGKPKHLSEEALERLSVEIADEIQDFLEKDLTEEEENQKPTNMPTPEQEALIARAKKVGLPETATEAEITTAETAQTQKEAEEKAENERKARAKKAGLPETATLAEIEAKENEPPPPTKSEQRKKVEEIINKEGRIYGDDLRAICPNIKDVLDTVEIDGLKLHRQLAFYYPAQ